MQIRSKLKNIQIFDYIYQVTMNAKNTDKRTKIIELCREKDSYLIALSRKGESEKGRILYYIDPVRSYTSGFCSNLMKTLLLCKYADENGFIPIFYCKTESHYAEKEPLFDTKVFLEYFFEKPVKEYKDEDIAWVTYDRESHHKKYISSESSQMHEIYVEMMKKYFRFNDRTLEELLLCEKSVIKDVGKTLGVKYRGTDYYEHFRGHPIPVTVKEIVREVYKIFDTGHYSNIFLATEDAEALDVFKKTFGTKLTYINSLNRYKIGSNHVDSSTRADLKYPAYTEGLNLLKDLWVLSRCGGFVGSRCGVSDFAIVFNEVYASKRFEYKKIIDKGTRSHGKISVNGQRSCN